MHSRITAFILGIFLSTIVISSARADVYGAVSGIVLDPTNRPMSGAVVMLEAPDTAPIHATTDASGRFIFPRVPFDTYTVTVEVNGYDHVSETVTVSSGNAVAVSFHLSPRTIGKVVTKAGGASITGQPVAVSVLSARSIQTLPVNQSLAKVIETVPGIVPFSYGEPVFRGFHGISYEVDGVPLPQTAGQYFSEIIDPRDINRLEVFTGAFPAEFGGQRQGGVVDILTKRPSEIGGNSGTVSVYGGSYGTSGVSLSQSAGGGGFRAFFGGNMFRNSRGLDAPTPTAMHDNSNQTDAFARLVYTPNGRDAWSFDYGTQYAAFQIPINTNQHDPNDSNWSVPGTDDNQHEYSRFANLSFSRISADNQGYFQISPWWSSGRIQYLPDPGNDLIGASQSTLSQDRYANYLGVATSFLRSFGEDNLKVGLAANVENATSRFSFQFIDPTTHVLQPTFTDNVAQRGSNFGLYVEDKHYVSPAVTLNAGLRYDHSTGFTSGHQISPRIELNLQPDPLNLVHLYYGRLYAAPLLEDVRRSAVVLSGASGMLPVYDLKPEHDSIYEAGVQHTFTPMVNGSINLWARSVTNVLDTTQIGSTPLFTLFNSAYGQAYGMELRLQGHTYSGNNYFLSYGTSLSQAKGISGGTFLFPISALQGASDWALEDHDQTNTINTAYTWNLSSSGRYATMQALFGSGFPVQFINGTQRLPVHWELGAAYGQPASRHSLGWEIDANNLLNHVYLIKVNNGFNSTQYAQGRSITVKLTAPMQ
jgi:outer membrane receptor for ferrienterochelin and colicins